MAADTAIAFTLICAAIMPILWTRVMDGPFLRKGYFFLSSTFLIIALYTVKSVVTASYPDAASVLAILVNVLLLGLGAMALWAFFDLGYGLALYLKDMYDRGKKWRFGGRHQSASQGY